VLLGLALIGLVFAPSASGAAQLDTATATGSTGPVDPPLEHPIFGRAALFDIDIDAHSGASGQDPGGTASFTLGSPSYGIGLSYSGSVTCLSVTGPGLGGGTATAPTTALLRFQDSASGVLVVVRLVDNGGNGADTMGFAQGSAPTPTGCSLSEFSAGPETGTLTNGRAVVFDAPPVPASKDECKGGEWRNFPQFKNQGDCVSFVETGE
jgi:hypothetical protein